MSSASANSSNTSMKKDVANKNTFEFKISGGYFVQDDKGLTIEEKYSIDSSIPMFEIASKEVGTHTIGKDSKGNTVRVDVKTGTKYVTGKDGKTKVVRRPKEKEQDR